MPEGGSIRRSFAVTTHGPGAIVDVRADGAPVSVVMAGLEVWERRGGTPAEVLQHTIREPRLERRLGVRRFRLPPVDPDERANGPHLAAVRFPRWLVCPKCHQLRDRWPGDINQAGRYCPTCTSAQPGQKKVWVIPVRFISVCDRGHLDEFPWNVWVRHRADCPANGRLMLETRGAGLAGLVVKCGQCQAERSLDGAFGEGALAGLRCRGLRPWLEGPPDVCDRQVSVQQRGASTLYYPIVESALSIPPFSSRIQEMLGHVWDSIIRCERARRIDFIQDLRPDLEHVPYSAAEIAQFVAELEDAGERTASEDLKVEEYRVLSASQPFEEPDNEFGLRPAAPPRHLVDLVDRMSRVVRLREVRAIRAFTRLTPPTGDFRRDTTRAADISTAAKDWLPAIEVRGEGVFLSLRGVRVSGWEQQEAVVERAVLIDRAWARQFERRFGADSLSSRQIITPRLVLLHTLAHALMGQLTLDCGYSAASLRERVYAGERPEMAGIMIYTATTDADGTLGGLASQGHADRLADILVEAIRANEWCSSDPLCIEGQASASEGLNLAACHACLLAPETSCEYFNRFLDRALLVGTPDDRAIGFFSGLLSG